MYENKLPVQPFNISEIREFVDYYRDNRQLLKMNGHTDEEVRRLAEFFGFGYWRKWTPEEVQIVKDNYNSLGTEGTAKLLPYRTKLDVSQLAHTMGLTTSKKDTNSGGYARWEAWEQKILKDYWAFLGARVAYLLPRHSEHACTGQASALNLRWHKDFHWTAEDDEYLLKHYPLIGMEVAAMLPGKTKAAIVCRAQKFGVMAPSPKWTKEQDEILKAYYPKIGRKVSAMIEGKTESSCSHRAKRLGISAKRNLPWTEEEIRILRENYPVIGLDVSDMLVDRDRNACRRMAEKLKLSRDDVVQGRCSWTKEEDQILFENYPQMRGDVELLLPNHSRSQCYGRASYLGISSPKPWTEEENRILRENYGKLGRNTYKLLPGRTPESCRHHAVSVLHLEYLRSDWTPEEDAILVKFYPSEGMKVAYRLPNRTTKAIYRRAYERGIKKNVIETT